MKKFLYLKINHKNYKWIPILSNKHLLKLKKLVGLIYYVEIEFKERN